LTQNSHDSQNDNHHQHQTTIVIEEIRMTLNERTNCCRHCSLFVFSRLASATGPQHCSQPGYMTELPWSAHDTSHDVSVAAGMVSFTLTAAADAAAPAAGHWWSLTSGQCRLRSERHAPLSLWQRVNASFWQ